MHDSQDVPIAIDDGDSLCSATASETTALLAPANSAGKASIAEAECFGLPNKAESVWLSMLHEVRVIAMASAPVIGSYILQMSFQTLSILIVSTTFPQHLSTAAFSYGFATATGWLVALGGSTALDTLASSSFTGSTDKHALGVLLQRALFVLTLLYVPVAILWYFSSTVFIYLGQDLQLSRDSCLFLRWLIPGGLGYIYFETTKKYLQAQGITRAGPCVLLITAPISAILNYLLVKTAGLGVLAAPVATGIGFWLSFIGLLLWIKLVEGSEAWAGWDRRSFHNLGTFVRLALLGILHVGTEWWAFEIVTIIAGQLGEVDLAAQSAIMTLDAAIASLPLGIGIAASARVGNMLGLRNTKRAAMAAHAAAILSMLVGALIGILLLMFNEQIARTFSPEAEIILLIRLVLPVIALYQVADGLNASCGGALRGMGCQHVGAAVNIVIYYCLALPGGA
ncbi:hypothetical protein CKM354_000617300 [Cercospora kikuchii]|uniref:MATE efflux family protein n=1 Tax=Cercospora kikuchii TaxID=84275 RepID=A0A9P3CHM8_9PEZI|nr:uncharacterized protein CKM354_000617300 [Cercospora kikuchii]GIZ42926.1 hypothetical protein CKM354_000617300 [Cercospora kikuchii]